VGGYLYLTRDPSPAERLQRANPGWTVVAVDGRPVHADDASGRGNVMLHPDDVGPYRMERVDCEAVRKVFPQRFTLPDTPVGNCLRLQDGERATWVLNIRTPQPAVPLISQLKFQHGVSPSPEDAAKDLPARGDRGSYAVYPREGSGERIVGVAFYRYANNTELIFTFRPAEPS
jgi:hypothetical protein